MMEGEGWEATVVGAQLQRPTRQLTMACGGRCVTDSWTSRAWPQATSYDVYDRLDGCQLALVEAGHLFVVASRSKPATPDPEICVWGFALSTRQSLNWNRARRQ